MEALIPSALAPFDFRGQPDPSRFIFLDHPLDLPTHLFGCTLACRKGFVVQRGVEPRMREPLVYSQLDGPSSTCTIGASNRN